MTGPTRTAWSTVPTEEERYRPLYARALGLRFVNPGGVLCFVFFEGAVALAVLLALAELVSWWAVPVLPLAVAVMVKLNDMVAEWVVRSAALVPEQERDRFRRQVEPVVGRARVPRTLPGVVVATEVVPGPPGERRTEPSERGSSVARGFARPGGNRDA
ncbi:hypothetical protein [Micromonospora coxensis]|uniref:Uncharacterized protein n=1 Tax=Micromonospora coxensis TaxID=356852 RepID=A0A1C5HX16_9ACTN|nr:hypothetical protein [Micromonospora coxensis]SCG50529.1 hypothetical protein GA0070614_1904 [Micromonospora coxensis]